MNQPKDTVNKTNMEEPTEEQKQLVIAYFKEQGFELYKTEGIIKVDQELIEARSNLKEAKDLLRQIALETNLSDPHSLNRFKQIKQVLKIK
jgi:hypothetical protein